MHLIDMIRSHKRAAAAITLAIGFVLWFWCQVAQMRRHPFPPPVEGTDYVNLLARGFRAGHTSLSVEPPEALKHLSDPYDPAQRGEMGLFDASYYHGRYYLYFGPAPVLLVVLPYQVLTGQSVSLPGITLGFVTIGYLALCATLVAIWRRYFPRASLLAVVAELLVLGMCTMLPALIRVSNMYEMTIAAGFGFFAVSLGCYYLALHRRARAMWFTVASLFLGFAVASRATYAVGVVMPMVILIWLWLDGRREERWQIWPDASWWQPAIGGGAVLTLIAVALIWYNQTRFGRPWETGLKYQLVFYHPAKVQYISVRYWWYNFRIYFAHAVTPLPEYPFIGLPSVPLPKPSGYHLAEWVTAMFPNFPIYFFVGALPLAVRDRSSKDLARWIAGALLSTAAVTAVLLLFVSSADRYMADFMPGWALLAGIGLLAFDANLSSTRGWRTVTRLCWLGLTLVSIWVGFAMARAPHLPGRP